MSQTFEAALSSISDVRLLTGYPAAHLTTFHIGGEVDYVVFPKTKDAIVEVIRLTKRLGIPYRIIGGGSNILARDEGFSGVWIVVRECSKVVFSDYRCEAECGAMLASVIEACATRGLAGAENLWGIPGTVGGAVVMNAGAFGTRMCDLVTAVQGYCPLTDTFVSLGYDECGFGYRESVFQRGEVVLLGASLRFSPCRTDLVRTQIAYVENRRRQSQPLEFPSAGSVFRRPPGSFAGQLIQEAGLRGYTVGGAQVSEKHAGFIINRGEATAADVNQLIFHIVRTVYDRSGIMLQTEIIRE